MWRRRDKGDDFGTAGDGGERTSLRDDFRGGGPRVKKLCRFLMPPAGAHEGRRTNGSIEEKGEVRTMRPGWAHRLDAAFGWSKQANQLRVYGRQRPFFHGVREIERSLSMAARARAGPRVERGRVERQMAAEPCAMKGYILWLGPPGRWSKDCWWKRRAARKMGRLLDRD